jgi:hypothetical protein
MQIHTTPLPGSALVDLKLLEDDRGFFARAFCRQEFIDAGLEPLVDWMSHYVDLAGEEDLFVWEAVLNGKGIGHGYDCELLISYT